MRYLLIIFVILSGYTLFSQDAATEPTAEINWMTWEEVYAAQEEEPRKVFVEVYTDWCGYCKKMDKSTFTDSKVIDYVNENFYAIKFNAEQQDTVYFNDRAFGYMADKGRKGCHALAFGLLNGRMGYPSSVLLDEELARIMTSPGYKNAQNLMTELTYASEDKYKETSWGNYQLSLRPEIPEPLKPVLKKDTTAVKN